MKTFLTGIITLGILIGMPMIAEAQWQVVFEDDFTDNRHEWYEGDEGEAALRIEAGRYLFEHKRTTGGWFVWKTIDINQQTDFQIQVTLQKTQGTDDYGYGIIWGRQDASNYYEWVISGTGYYRYGKVQENEWQEMIPWTTSEQIKPGNGTNVLVVNKHDGQLTFSINDQEVNTAAFENFFGNQVGFVVYNEMQIAVEDLRIQQVALPEPTPTPQPEVVPPEPETVEHDQPKLADSAVLTGSDKRIALVIGNSAYTDPPLAHPLHDAEAVATILHSYLGCTVIKQLNVSLQEMAAALQEFVRRVQQAEIALVYFAGYAAQVRGDNYLIPVGTTIRSESHLPYDAVKLDEILDYLTQAETQANIVILDACREINNLWLFNKGLAALNPPPRTAIAYATAPGYLTPDIPGGRNSVYTKHLLNALRTSGITLQQMFDTVRQQVQLETDGQQSPWFASSLPAEFSLSP
ncbi:hypothetical protein GF339_16230 [candidate division KSB3 bacterium]|uniref:Caspase family p20 domain-containing protein n=1 Tax=candidate division KSB3 bacterium TaxID=2044937 RepID=A0A9D5JXX6_9BACT|nr:hypothetical protein [candidate division KSB3 bacterium]MBD3326135.1 hypothetical protein [candidate division KSB3 bacterium]